MRNLRKVLALGVLALGLSVANGASALSYVVSGPADGSYAAGTTLTFSVALDQATSINGFELFYDWTEAALDITSVSNRFPDNLPADFFPLTVDDRGLGDATTGTGRVSSIQLTPFSTTALFDITFQSTGKAGTMTIYFAGSSGNGLSPAMPVSNPDLSNIFTFTQVPEPGALALLGLGCLGLVAAGRRRA